MFYKHMILLILGLQPIIHYYSKNLFAVKMQFSGGGRRRGLVKDNDIIIITIIL
jgi:hypothetical protein